MSYATVQDVQDRMSRTLSEDETVICSTLLDDAAVIIDAYNVNAQADAKKVVSCRMVIRMLGDGGPAALPVGASQASMAGLGYSQSFTFGSSGVSGEMYLSKLDKKLLGCGNAIGTYSPVEDLVEANQ